MDSFAIMERLLVAIKRAVSPNVFVKDMTHNGVS